MPNRSIQFAPAAVLLVALMGVSLLPSRAEAQGTTVASKQYTYVWLPRWEDVQNKDAKSLSALLDLVSIADYEVKKGDNLDFIIRQLFAVSSTRHPHAFTLYQAKIRSLNASMDLNQLSPGIHLRVPAGPRYSAVQISLKGAAASRWKDHVFDRLAAKAAGKDNPGALEAPAVRSRLGRALKSFFVREDLEEVSDLAAYDMAKESGLTLAVDLKKHPEEVIAQAQPLTINVASSPASMMNFSVLKENNPNLVLAHVVPMSKTMTAVCPKCVSCAEALQLPAHFDFSRARVLVQDTGLDSNVQVDASHFLYKGASGDGADVDSLKHGTFVYSQLSASAKGAIPDAQLYIAKSAKDDSGNIVFPMNDIIGGWTEFVNVMRRPDSVGIGTWIVNLSAAGPPETDAGVLPAPPADPNVLVIAAAGNDGTSKAAQNDIFDKFSNGALNLIIVGALNDQDNPTNYTNFHPTNVQLFARGDCVCGAPGQIVGTSQAAPIVTTAAAALASKRPNLEPQEIMWRLLSTADRLPSLRLRAFAGKVNVLSALTDEIIVRVSDPMTGKLSELGASTVRFSANWSAAIGGKQSVLPENPILRLYDRTEVGPQSCFSYISYQILQEGQLCIPSTEQLTISSGQGTKTVPAAQIVDVILPLPSDRSNDVKLPEVSVR